MDEAPVDSHRAEARVQRDAGHAPTHADVFVHEALLCLEVQLNPTQFRRRTRAREAKGSQVCWLIREGLDTEKALKALFGLPAVRFRVIDRDDLGRLSRRGTTPGDRRLARRARLQIFGTVAYRPLPDKRPDWFNTHKDQKYLGVSKMRSSTPGLTFLGDEVRSSTTSGERRRKRPARPSR